MLIKTLYNLFCGSESQDRRSDCAPDVIEEKEHIVIIPEKFKDDLFKPPIKPPYTTKKEKYSIYS